MTAACSRVRGIGGLSAIALLIAGCAQTPMGPTIPVMPGPGRTFESFQADQALCKNFATSQVQGQAEAANQRAVGAAALTTVLGAGVGAAAGSFGGVAGRGAGIGAASGAALGTGIGAANSSNAQLSIQQQYDNAFAQCMYSKGHQVPGFAPAAAMPPPSAPPVAMGPDPALVRATQAELIRLHYLNGGADGAMGPHTAEAIRAYQQASGLPATGAPSQALLARLQATPGGEAAASASAASPAAWVPPKTQ